MKISGSVVLLFTGLLAGQSYAYDGVTKSYMEQIAGVPKVYELNIGAIDGRNTDGTYMAIINGRSPDAAYMAIINGRNTGAAYMATIDGQNINGGYQLVGIDDFWKDIIGPKK